MASISRMYKIPKKFKWLVRVTEYSTEYIDDYDLGPNLRVYTYYKIYKTENGARNYISKMQNSEKDVICELYLEIPTMAKQLSIDDKEVYLKTGIEKVKEYSI